MPKPKKEQITIRVLPETRRAIEQLSQDNLITLGDALDLLVKSSPKRPRPQKEPHDEPSGITWNHHPDQGR